MTLLFTTDSIQSELDSSAKYWHGAPSLAPVFRQQASWHRSAGLRGRVTTSSLHQLTLPSISFFLFPSKFPQRPQCWPLTQGAGITWTSSVRKVTRHSDLNKRPVVHQEDVQVAVEGVHRAPFHQTEQLCFALLALSGPLVRHGHLGSVVGHPDGGGRGRRELYLVTPQVNLTGFG